MATETYRRKKQEIADLRDQLREAQEELLVAKRNAESWQETAQQAQNERDAAIGRAEASERALRNEATC